MIKKIPKKITINNGLIYFKLPKKYFKFFDLPKNFTMDTHYEYKSGDWAFTKSAVEGLFFCINDESFNKLSKYLYNIEFNKSIEKLKND